MCERHFNVEYLLQPVELALFFQHYWGQQPLVLLRHDPQYYAGLFAMRDVDVVLRCGHLRYPDIQLTRQDQAALPQEMYVGMPTPSPQDYGVPDVNRLYRAYAQGGILFVRALQQHWATVAALCRSLEQCCTHPVNADLYLVHKDSQGFRPHYHPYDDFVLQLEGSELWRTYDFTPQPSVHPSNQPLLQEELPPPAQEVYLQPGDLLYIPRGCVHHALAPERASLHLVLSMHAFTWADLLTSALASLSDEDAAFHEPLPVGFLNDRAWSDALRAPLAALLARFARGSTVEAAVEHLARRFIGGMAPLPDGQALHLDDLGQVDLEAVVTRRQGMVCWIARTGDTVSIHFPGNAVQGPALIEPALRFIAEAGVFPVRALPDALTEQSKVVLVRRLMREGLLTMVPPAPSLIPSPPKGAREYKNVCIF
jgi:Cupin superfamily protein